jgi:hypothetical protein
MAVTGPGGAAIAAQRVIEAGSVNSAAGRSRQGDHEAKVTMSTGICGLRGECSVAADWLSRSSESS